VLFEDGNGLFQVLVTVEFDFLHFGVFFI
jgi:hypothetical protein